jgi:hypothetical protein
MPAPTSALAAAAAAAELLAVAAVVHRLVRQPMRERGLPRWTVGDTLLTSPLFFGGAGLFLVGIDGAILALASAAEPVLPWAIAAAAGLTVAAFGLRAFGKLY